MLHEYGQWYIVGENGGLIAGTARLMGDAGIQFGHHKASRRFALIAFDVGRDRKTP